MIIPSRHGAPLVQRAFRISSDDLSLQVVRGAGYAAAGVALRTGVTLISVAVLARVLSPADFGYVVMANLVTELAFVFSSFGLGEIIIQRRRLARVQLDTIWWASLAIGICLMALVVGASFLSMMIFANPLAGELLRDRLQRESQIGRRRHERRLLRPNRLGHA